MILSVNQPLSRYPIISGTPAILDRCVRPRGIVREDSLSLPYRWEVVNVLGRRGLVRISCALAFGSVKVRREIQKTEAMMPH